MEQFPKDVFTILRSKLKHYVYRRYKILDYGISDEMLYNKVLNDDLFGYGSVIISINNQIHIYYVVYENIHFTLTKLNYDEITERNLFIPVKMYYPRKFEINLHFRMGDCKACRQYGMIYEINNTQQQCSFNKRCPNFLIDFTKKNIIIMGDVVLSLKDIQDSFTPIEAFKCAKCSACKICERIGKSCKRHLKCTHYTIKNLSKTNHIL